MSLEKPRALCCFSLFDIELVLGLASEEALGKHWLGVKRSGSWLGLQLFRSAGLSILICKMAFLIPILPTPFLLGYSEH